MPTDYPSIAQVRAQYDATLRHQFPFFFRHVMATIAPAAHYQHNWHIDAISEYLAACAKGELTRLMINLPPRMLKSSVVSVAWPAWLLAHQPARRIMAASYTQSLSIKHSMDCRAVMESAWYRRVFPHVLLSREQNEKEKFSTTQRGYRLAVSVGGAAIGEGGDILIVDDPINPLQAMHPVQRTAVNAWFDHTFVTRLDDKRHGAMVVVMQRLHAEDLSGYLLKKGGWEHLCLPAIAPETTWIHYGRFTYMREPGSPLHAAREDRAMLARAQQELGSANFNAQYQQAPLSQVGALVPTHWCPRFGLTGEQMEGRIIQSWDTGIKAGAQHDASACATFVEYAGYHYLIDMTVVRMEYPSLKRLMISHAARFQPDAVLIEDKASGQSLIQDLRMETPLPVIAITPVGDKLARMVRVTPMLEAGKVYLPENASWLAAFEAELFTFPDATHDDQVDAFGQYLLWSRGHDQRVAPSVRRV